MYNASITWTTSKFTTIAAFNVVGDALKVYEAMVKQYTEKNPEFTGNYFSFNCDSGMYTVDLDMVNNITLSTKEESAALSKYYSTYIGLLA